VNRVELKTLVAYKLVHSLLLAAMVGLLGACVDSGPSTASAPNGRAPQEIAENVDYSSEDNLDVPILDDPTLIANGAAEYAVMCADCHLGPGVADNELRKSLNPPPPELAKLQLLDDVDLMAARQFRIVKYGIKGSAMPAWGATHDDPALWSIVAFLSKLPTLTPEQYAQITANAMAVHGALHPRN
jgi:mono/diheme cytochrome c family protein